MTGVWERDIDHDLSAIRQWGASDLITLLEPHEFIELGIVDLPQHAATHGLRWHGLPITDGAAPDSRFLTPWKEILPTLLRNLEEGQRIVVHCKGGLGRAGTVASMLLLSSGACLNAKSAIALVRGVRPGAIETLAQEEFIAHWIDAEDFSGHRPSTSA
jgi:ADP-ribosyl-[dinitrogen reductase] hydrolase